MTQSRWKSPVVWTTIAAQVLTILVVTGVIDPTKSDTINAVIATVLQALVAFGVLNNPTDGKGF